jgi:hypothetical protein
MVVGRKQEKPTLPRTLAEVHEWVHVRFPPEDASLTEKITFRRENKRMYERVADIDRGHFHESMAFASFEERRIGELEEMAAEVMRSVGAK